MALPKNYQQTTNLTKRIDSLNNITFYHFNYTVKLTDDFTSKLFDEQRNPLELEDFLGKIFVCGDKKIKGENRVYALNKEQAIKKLNKWLNISMVKGIISEYVINNCEEKTFNEEVMGNYEEFFKN